ncbi:E3 ubiquitin-protein ligase MGRN1-like isoform X2 [Lampetra planeri]
MCTGLTDVSLNAAVKMTPDYIHWPGRSGNYFASHFYMGGEKFESGTPESYLFGENADLNFLGSRPVPFPYPAPPPSEPVRALRSLVNIRKDSLRLVRCSEEVKPDDGEGRSTRVRYNVEFTFDSDARVQLCIFYQATEGMHAGAMRYIPKTPSLKSEVVSFQRGAGQQFCLPSHSLELSDWSIQEMTYDPEKEMYPMVIQASVAEGGEHAGHSHILIATFDKAADGSFSVKPLKQKQVVDGVGYLLQEIYGIENKNSLEPKSAEEDGGDNSGECVVCLSDVRDTIILPCRHLCLCNACADTLRYQANNCPICRLPFRALLQIRAVRRKVAGGPSPAPLLAAHTSDTEESSEPLPPGYEAVSLLEALNGPPPLVASAPPLARGEEPPPARQPPLPCHRRRRPPPSRRRHGAALGRRDDDDGRTAAGRRRLRRGVRLEDERRKVPHLLGAGWRRSEPHGQPLPRQETQRRLVRRRLPPADPRPVGGRRPAGAAHGVRRGELRLHLVLRLLHRLVPRGGAHEQQQQRRWRQAAAAPAAPAAPAPPCPSPPPPAALAPGRRRRGEPHRRRADGGAPCRLLPAGLAGHTRRGGERCGSGLER